MSASWFIKCVTVGDGAIGKTCLLISYTSNTFPTVGESSEIVVEEPSTSQQRQNLFVKLPKTLEGSTEDSVTINMPLSPILTPKRVNFSPFPSPNQHTMDIASFIWDIKATYYANLQSTRFSSIFFTAARMAMRNNLQGKLQCKFSMRFRLCILL